MKTKIRIYLLLFISVFALIGVLVFNSLNVKAEKPEVHAFVDVEYVEHKYTIKDNIPYGVFKEVDKDSIFLNEERTLKIPYFALKIASKDFDKDLKINKITLSVTKEDVNNKGDVSNEKTFDREYVLDKKDFIKPYSIDTIYISNKIKGFELINQEKANANYYAVNHILSKISNKNLFETVELEKTKIRYGQKIDFVENYNDKLREENHRRDDKGLPSLKAKLLSDTEQGINEAFGFNKYYFKIYISPIVDFDSQVQGAYIKEVKIKDIVLNKSNTASINFTDLEIIPAKHIIKDDIYEHINYEDKILKERIEYQKNRKEEKALEKKKNITIALSVVVPIIVLTAIITPTVTVIKRKKNKKI